MRVYLKPDEVEIKDPPTIVRSIKNKAELLLSEYIAKPDVAIEDVTDNKMFAKLSSEFIKK